MTEEWGYQKWEPRGTMESGRYEEWGFSSPEAAERHMRAGHDNYKRGRVVRRYVTEPQETVDDAAA